MKEKFKNAPDEYMFHPLAESAQVRSDMGVGREGGWEGYQRIGGLTSEKHLSS